MDCSKSSITLMDEWKDTSTDLQKVTHRFTLLTVLHMHQIDVVICTLTEEIYMTQPKGDIKPEEEHGVSKLNKSMDRRNLQSAGAKPLLGF